MKLKAIFTALIFIGFGLCLANIDKASGQSSHEISLAQSSNKFGFNIFKEIINSKHGKDKNVFISPLSISMALTMTYNGANGETKEAMAKTLELSDMSIDNVNDSYAGLIELLTHLDPDVTFEIANSIWFRQGYEIEKEFIDINHSCFHAQVRNLNFSAPDAADIINAWVDDNTSGKIKEIVSKPIDPLMVMFLINAIYFYGDWTYPFKAKDTQDDEFTLLDDAKTSCKMMHKEQSLSYFENSDFQAVNLPYGDKVFSMTVILPKPEIHIDKLTSMLNNDSWENWLSNFTKQNGSLYLPKFKLEYGLSLVDALKAMGMDIAFAPGKADFSGINEKEKLFISEVKHKTFVRVDEKGTEAAAVTSVGMMTTSLPPQPAFVMRVDRPFIFVISENKSQSILFMGKIIEPVLE